MITLRGRNIEIFCALPILIALSRDASYDCLNFILVGTMAVLTLGTSQMVEQSPPISSIHSGDSPYVFETLRTYCRFENDGTGSVQIEARIRILSQAGIQLFQELSFQYKPSRERLVPHYVHVLKPDGKIIDVETAPRPNPRMLFHEGGSSGFDVYERTLSIPISLGDAIEYDVEIITYAPEIPGHFVKTYSFTSQCVLNEEFVLDVPSDRVVKLRAVNNLQHSIKTLQNRTTYSWHVLQHASNLCLNRTLTERSSSEVPDIHISSFLDWNDVGRWYQEIETNRRISTPEVKTRAEELTAGLKSDQEKIAAVYEFVSKHIEYFSLAPMGIAGYESRSAEQVLRLGYGDCKDKEILLLALLDAKGFHASSVLISPIRVVDPEIPSPWPFTHVIAMLQLGKEEIWMDSTARAPFRMLPPVLRNKKVLVVPPVGMPYFQQTPKD